MDIKRWQELMSRGSDLYARGAHAESAEAFQECLTLFDAPQKRSQAFGSTLVSLGSALAESGDAEGAIQHFRNALPLFASKEDLEARSTIHFNIGNAKKYLNEYSDALKEWEFALLGFRRLADIQQVAMCLTAIANLLVSFGNSTVSSAAPYVDELDHLLPHLQKDQSSLRAYFQLLAKIRFQEGDLPGAARIGRIALQHAIATGDQHYVADTSEFLEIVERRRRE